MSKHWKSFLGLLALLLPSLSIADEPTPVDRFYVAEGLEATVWAQAPMFYNPTNMDTDVQGRIWVTEAVNQFRV